ncbi:MAG TPA: STAS/SEC14 domain-containing protein [Polyangiaceae bacterium]|jgi:hypothetical protein|nr:STAS/SEC14 domain-containing protein [Polyangiaceae bacterium]
MARREVKSRTGMTWLDEMNNVIRFDAFEGVEQSLADAKENMEAVRQLSDGEKLGMLVNLSKSRGLGPEAREYYGSDAVRPLYRALAIMGSSPISRMLANMWFTIYGDKHCPTRVFASETEAIAWLKGFSG